MLENRKDMFRRNALARVVPLATPYRLSVDVASACNFRCSFCFHALEPKALARTGFSPAIMDWDLFRAIIRQAAGFPEKIKCLGLGGIGEPLLNRRLPDMVRLTKEASVSDKVVITTNASLLSPECSRALIDAGLDELIVSLEGLSSEKYAAITRREVDVGELLDHVRTFFEHRGSTRLFVKIVDIALEGPEQEQAFHDLFDPISDLAYVEKIIPQFQGVDYAALGLDGGRTLFGVEVPELDVCPMIFYAMQVTAAGNVCPCCVDVGDSVVFGNVSHESLVDIWSGRAFNDFRRMHLRGDRKGSPLCRDCDYLRYSAREEDILDPAAGEILGRLGDGREGP